MGKVIKGQHREVCGDETVLYLDCGGVYMTIHVIKLNRAVDPQMNVCKASEI